MGERLMEHLLVHEPLSRRNGLNRCRKLSNLVGKHVCGTGNM